MTIADRQRLAFCLLGLLLASLGTVHVAPAQHFSHKQFTVYEGLAYNNVLSLHQDRTGRIWVGTVFGLNLYDGGRQITNHNRFPNLPQEYVDDLASGPDGHVWAASGQRLFRIREVGGTSLNVTEVPIDYGTLTGRKRSEWLTVDHRGVPYLTVESQLPQVGKRLYRLEGNRLRDVTRMLFANPDQRFRGLQADWPNRRLLLLTQDGRLWSLSGNRLRLLRTPVRPYQLLTDPAGRVYALDSLALYRFEGTALRKCYSLPIDPLELYNCTVSNGGEVAYQNRQKVLCWYDGRTRTEVRALPSWIHGIRFDRQDNLWVGTASAGLFQIQRSGWRYFDATDGKVEDLNSISEDRQGRIWFGSPENGLLRLAGGRILPDSSYRRTVASHVIFPATTRDADGNLLIATLEPNAVIHFNGERYKRLPGPDTTGRARGFFDDVQRNRYLIPTPRTVFSYHRETLRWQRAFPRPPGECLDVETDKFGRYWLGGYEFSLIWDGHSTRFRTLRLQDSTLPARHVHDLQRDERGNLWLATDQGLWWYDYRRFHRRAAQYLPRAVMFCRPVGRFLLLGTLEGVYFLDVKAFYETGQEWLAYFDHENGFAGMQCWFNGTIRDSKGRLWIGTRDHIMVNEEAPLLAQLKPVATGIESFRDLQTGSVRAASGEVVQFSSRQNDLEVRLREPDSLNRLLNTTYSFRLERLDADASAPPDWSGPVRGSVLRFRNLSDGTYRLSVRVLRTSKGLWNTQPFQQEFRIAPPWFATWWFRTLLVAAVVGGIAYWRIRQLRLRAQRRIESVQTQRRLAQLELTEAKMQQRLAETGRQRALLEVKAITNQIDPHFVSNFLTAIQSVAYERDPELVVRYLAKFGALFRSQLLSRRRVFWTLQEELNFVRNYLDLERLRFRERIRSEVGVCPGVPPETTLPKMLIQGYVSNAIKHGLEHRPEGGTVRVQVCHTEGYLKITVEDDGVGLEQARQYRRRSTGQGLGINEAIFDQLNQYNTLKSFQQIIDLTDATRGTSGVRMEAQVPLFPNLPPEEYPTERHTH